MSLIPFFTLVVVSLVFRGELGAKSLLIYWSVWAVGLAVAVLNHIQPGFFLAFQCCLAVAMLIQLRVNPNIS